MEKKEQIRVERLQRLIKKKTSRVRVLKRLEREVIKVKLDIDNLKEMIEDLEAEC